MAERENEKIQRGYEQALAFLDKQEGVDPAIKQQHLNQISQAYLGHIAGQKESSKDTGHPMTDMVKNIATNLIGGQLPKKGAPLDQGLIGQAFVAMSDPANRTDNLLARLNSDFATALKTGNVADIRTATAHPEYSKIVAEGRRLTGKQDWQPDIFQSLAADPFTAQREKLQAAALNNPRVQARFGMTTPPPTQAQASQTAVTTGPTAPVPGFVGLIQDQSGAVATPGQTQSIPTGGSPQKQQTLFSYIADKTREQAEMAYYSKLTGLPMPPDEPLPKVGDPENVVDSSGKRRIARYLPTDLGPFKAGYYDHETGEYLTGVQKASPVNPESAPKILSPEQITKSSVELKTHVRKALKNPALIQAAEAAIDSNLASNDLKGAGDILTRYMQMQQTQDSTEAARAIAAGQHAIAASNHAGTQSMKQMQMASDLSKNFLASEEAKGMHAADRVATNTNLAYQAIRKGGDPGIYQLEMLRNWAKATDIMTGVKEGEYQSLEEAIGRLRQAGVMIDNFMDFTGKRIDPKMEKAVVDSINRIRDTQYGLFERKRKTYEDQLKQFGLGTSPLLSNTYAAPVEEKASQAPAKVSALDPRAPRRRAGKSEEPPVTPGKSATVNKPKITVKPI